MERQIIKHVKMRLLMISLGILGISACTKEEESKNCGCDSETAYIIPNEEFEDVYGIPPEEQMAGELFYKHNEVVDGFADHVEEFENKFWIFQGTKGCGNCERKFIVCNENLVGEEFQYLKNEGEYDSIPVQFSGEVKPYDECIAPFIAPADIYYATIKLNSISNAP